ncbi:alkaline phosphatase [Biomphalaria glabrata]|nr:alkaline phosphatase [Biomphalaria glabrata]
MFWICLTLASLTTAVMAVTKEDISYQRELTGDYWLDGAHGELQKALENQNRGVAKNIILFIGDGMGPPSVTAGRILAGQLQGKKGEEFSLTFEKFPQTGLSKTYAVDEQVTDSAAAATAFLCGVKTNRKILGLNARAQDGNCSSTTGANVHSILRWATNAGKSTGIVTTTRITHATPAGAYAHSPDRDWESDRLIPSSEKQCKDIAYQLIKENSDINVSAK